MKLFHIIKTKTSWILFILKTRSKNTNSFRILHHTEKKIIQYNTVEAGKMEESTKYYIRDYSII